MTHLDDSLCADLVLALVPPAERRAALAHAAGCEECARRLQSHVAAALRGEADRAGPRMGRVLRFPGGWGFSGGIAAAAALAAVI